MGVLAGLSLTSLQLYWSSPPLPINACAYFPVTLIICSNCFYLQQLFLLFAAIMFYLQQLYFICCNFILFAAILFNLQQLFYLQQLFLLFAAIIFYLQQLYLICSNFFICSMSPVGHHTVQADSSVTLIALSKAQSPFSQAI